MSKLVPVLPGVDAAALQALDREGLKQAVLMRVDEALALCRSVHPALPAPEVWFDLRGKSAGQAHFGRKGLRFNVPLLEDNRAAFLTEVVPHEVAHWMVWHLEDGPLFRPHGREWQTVMVRLFGLPPNVTHCFDTARSSPAPYRYRCDCREHHFSAQRHANARAGREYCCKVCRSRLQFCPESGLEKVKRQ
uniref:SprT family zinc-dependent metalloprotease n=1 Tax=Halomonas sp. TaxID=1486246 RepID=UPI0026227BC5|nr:SprT-like domain-containing protein [Halomonas sp.]